MRNTLLALCMAATLITGVELWYRSAGGFPGVMPGLSPLEAKWRIQSSNDQAALYVIGDSRVGWGISESGMEQALAGLRADGPRAINLGIPGNAVASTLSRLTAWRATPATVLVALSPASLYHFSDQFITVSDQRMTIQDALDERLENAIKEWLYTYRQDPWGLWRLLRRQGSASEQPKTDWVARSFSDDGLAHARLKSSDGGPVDLAGHQLRSYAKMMDRIRAAPARVEKGNAALTAAVAQAVAKGWRVFFFRMPVGPVLAEIEEPVLEERECERLAAASGVAFLRVTRERPRLFIDQSHLTPESAREFSADLAAALSVPAR